MPPITFKVLNKKCGLIWLFSSSSFIISRRFSVSNFSNSSSCNRSSVFRFSSNAMIYSPVANFILLNARTSSPSSSSFSTCTSSIKKSFAAIFWEACTSFKIGDIMVCCIRAAISAIPHSRITPTTITTTGTLTSAGTFF